jgi:hypothetical protein
MKAGRIAQRRDASPGGEWRKGSAPLSYLSIGTETLLLDHPPRIHGMSFPGKVAALATAAVLAACSFPRPDPQTYQATIERIEERSGELYYSPLKGQEPLICIYLDVVGPANVRRPMVVRLLVLDAYKPAIHGRVGDSVLFSFPGELPGDGEVDFDRISDYRIIPRRP